MPEGRPRGPIPRAAAGYSVEGRGFYVWEEDAREAQLSGGALLRVVGSSPGQAVGAGESGRGRGIDDGGATC